MSFMSSEDDEDPHSFDSCPLRTSSSLFIVKQEDQTIVTATDEIFNILGYNPSDVIGKTIDELLETVASPDNTFPLRCIARDKRGTRIKFQACIHRNPLHHRTTSTRDGKDTTSPLLDYWLVRPLVKKKKKQDCTRSRYCLPMDATTVLLLSPYGIVDRVYHVMDEELQPASATTRQLIGMPIMAFIHSEDLQILCGQLNMTYQRIQPTFDIRWLTNGCTSKQEEDYQWITITGMPISFSAQSNHMLKQSAQITCVIEPIALSQEEERHYQRESQLHPPYQLIETIQGMLVSLYNDLYDKAISGKIYVFEFLTHVLMNIIPLATILTTNEHLHNDNEVNDDEEDDEYASLQNNNINEKRQQRTRRQQLNNSRRRRQEQPDFIAVQKMDRIEIVPLVNKVQSSCKAALDTYYYPIVKDILSVSNSIGGISQILPPAEIPLSTLESYIEWVTTAIRPTASKQYY